MMLRILASPFRLKIPLVSSNRLINACAPIANAISDGDSDIDDGGDSDGGGDIAVRYNTVVP